MKRSKLIGHGVPLSIAVVAGFALGIAAMSLFGLPDTPARATLTMGGLASAIALAALLLSWKLIRAGRHNAKATVTFQHIARTQADGDMIKARAIMKEAKKNGNVARFATTTDPKEIEVAAAINLILNDLEVVSIGIQRGIIDCQLFRSWCESSTVDYWKNFEEYVIALRNSTGHKFLFVQLQAMAKAWNTEAADYKPDPNSPFC